MMKSLDTDRIEIPKSWKTAAKKIIFEQHRKVLVIGASDRGKSTYCNFLESQIYATGPTVAFVDADVGQKDIGLPATISLACNQSEHRLSRAESTPCYFVGAVSPVRHFLTMVIGTRKMADMAQSDFIIINTTGLVHGSGRILKGFQIEALHPDVIVTIEKDDELDAIVNAYRNMKFLRIKPSRFATKKSSHARKKARERMFNAYFSHAKEHTLEISRLQIQRLPLFCGAAYNDPRFVYAEHYPEGTTAVLKEQDSQKYSGIYTLPFGFERNLLCGLGDRQNLCQGLSIVKKIEYQDRTVTLLTQVAKRKINILQFGDMYVSPIGEEIHHGLITTKNNST